MLSLLSGDPGAGKTTLALGMAAALTRGEVPFSDERLEAPENVVYMTVENSPEYVLRPQFDRLKGNPKFFSLILGTEDANGNRPQSISLKDVEVLSEALRQTAARLVVIDPLQSYLGVDVDSFKTNQTRPILDGLNRLASEHQCAFLILRHLNKQEGGKAIYRGGGSIDFTGAARSELYLEKHPDDDSRRIMAHAKTNLGELGPSLVFTNDAEGVLVCEGESRFRADDLAGGEVCAKPKSKVEGAEDFIRAALADGAMESTELETRAAERGISSASLRRAREKLKLDHSPGGFGGHWIVSLPATIAQ